MATEKFIDVLKEADKVSLIEKIIGQAGFIKLTALTDYVKASSLSGFLKADGSVKVIDNLQVGDRSGEAQVTLDSKTGTDSHIVISRNGTSKSSIGLLTSNDKLIIEQRADADIEFLLPAGSNIVAKIGAVFQTLMSDLSTEKMIREFRKTVQHDIADHAKPTRAECIDTFKMIPHFDWTKDDDYYIQDTSGSKLVLIKYRAGSATDEASAGTFHFEVLTTAV